MTNNYEGSISFVPIKVSSPPNRQILAYQIFTSTPDPFYLNDPFYTEGAKQIESLVMYIVQTESLCNQLEVLDALKVGNSGFVAHKTKENTRFGMIVIKKGKTL